jgi:hypothetical protein
MAFPDLFQLPVYQQALHTPSVMIRLPATHAAERDKKSGDRDLYRLREAGFKLDHMMRNALSPDRYPDWPPLHICSAIKTFLEVIDGWLPRIRLGRDEADARANIQPWLDICGIMAQIPIESDLKPDANCRCSRRSKAQSSLRGPNGRQDQMAIRGLLAATLFMTVGAIAPTGAQTPPSSPQSPQGFQVPGKTPQERCYYRYRTAHNYNHVGPKAMAACPDPNQEQPNPD